MKCGRELVANIGHCLFFTKTNCTWKSFSCFVLRGDLTTQSGILFWLVVVATPLQHFFSLQ